MEIHELQKVDGCINLQSGIKFNFFEPTPEMVEIEDIANGLAYNSHFGGHTPAFFSIAQHSLMVLDFYFDNSTPGTINYDLALACLLHDASEAYTGDMVKPLKVRIKAFHKIEKRIEKVIFQKYNIDFELLERVKPYDIHAQKIEFDNFYRGINTINYLTPKEAKEVFLDMFKTITNM